METLQTEEQARAKRKSQRSLSVVMCYFVKVKGLVKADLEYVI